MTRYKTDIIVALFLFAIALIVRLPFFNSVVIDADESTFILMGRNLLEGNLPYVTLWDNKPPLGFAVFAAFLSLWPSIPGIRFEAIVYISVAAYVLYRAGLQLGSRYAAFAMAAMMIIYASVFKSGEAVMTEHIALLPLSFISLYLLRPRRGYPEILLIGLCIGLSGLIRTNLFLLAPALALVIVMEYTNFRNFFYKGICAIIGTFLPVAILILLYAGDNQQQLLWNSLVVAPMAFAQSYNTAEKKWYFFLLLLTTLQTSFMLLWLALGTALARIRRYDLAERRAVYRLFIFSSFTLFSMWISGSKAPHYMIQLLPFACPIACYGIANLRIGKKLRLSLLAIICIIPLYPVFARMGEHLAGTHEDEYYTAADYLNQQDLQYKTIFACNTQILYFLTQTPVPVYYAHSTNIFRQFLVDVLQPPGSSVAGNIGAMMDKKPAFFIIRTQDENCRNVLKTYESHYRLDQIFGELVIYKYHE